MRGSVLISYEEGKQSFGLPLYQLNINDGTNLVRDYQFTEGTNLYSTYIFSGNTLAFSIRGLGYGEIGDIKVYLNEYTNDDMNGDNGVKTTFITGQTGTNLSQIVQIAFTQINPSPNCFDFNVNIVASVTQGCAEMGVISGTTGTGFTYTTTNEVARKSVGAPLPAFSDYIYIGLSSTFTTIRYTHPFSVSNVGRVFRVAKNYQNDPSFDTKTSLGNSYYQINDIEEQNDTKVIVVGGHSFDFNIDGYSLNRLLNNGDLDPTFTRYLFNGGPDSITDVVQQSDGKIIVSGNFGFISSSIYNKYARFNYDGTIDNTYYSGGTSTGFNDPVNCEIDVTNDKVYFFGVSNTLFNGTGFGAIMRLNTNGQLDTTFNGTGRGGFTLTASNASVSSILILANGNILCFGAFDKYNGQTCPKGVAMLNEDGTLNTTFNAGGAGFINTGVTYTGVTFTTFPTETLNQDENKYLIVGDFSGATYNGQSLPKDIFFLNSDGTLGDNTNLGTGIEGFPKTCKLLPNGSYFITGQLSGFNGTDINNGGLLQLSSTGQLQNC